MYAVPAPSEKTPTVLVVGATGETGRQVVKKLILKGAFCLLACLLAATELACLRRPIWKARRSGLGTRTHSLTLRSPKPGYRVQVLVRNLYSTTLNLLGTGVSYMKGDLADVASLRAACEGADKVVFVAQARDDADARAVEYQGLRNLAQAFQDTRVTESGKRVTTKRTLFKFRKPVDRDVWGVNPASASPGAEGSWTVEDAKAGRPAFKGTLPATGSVALESKKITINLAKFGGLLMLFKAEAADPQTQFKFVIRTSLYAEQGVQYELALPPVRNRFLAFRMNFKDFVPMKDGKPYAGLGLGALGLGGGAVALDPADVRQFAVQASRDGADGASGDGAFAVTVEGIKVFRARDQPDLVVLSSSDITPQTALKSLTEMESDPALALERVERRNYYKAQGELALKNSGLAYTIVRISGFTSSPTEGRPLSVSKAGNNMGLISRPDAAEVAINCLFNPTVCNTEIYASENPRYGDRDIQRLLNELVELPF
jgi:NAD(P)-dependent dehydrogenase (short-subunit alcohol dehydrogenase family)